VPSAEIGRIAILGAGNGGCAAVADLSRRGFELRMYSRSAATLAPLRERGGVEYSGMLGEGFVPVALITDDLDEAMAGADLVLSTVPTHAHQNVAAAVAGHLQPRQLLMLVPGHTLLLVPETLRRHGVAAPVTCETGTLPYICRMQGPAHVRISKAAESVAFGVFPARETTRIAELIRPVLPAIDPRGSVLETVFSYTNAIHHPPAMLCNAGRVEATGGD
jgi:opine dehydrogenase